VTDSRRPAPRRRTRAGLVATGSDQPAPAGLGEEVVVERFVAEGRALGRLADGCVVLLRGAVPGDRVRLTELRRKRDYAEVERFELVSASTVRVIPECAVAEQCGGCDWMVLQQAEHAEHKRRVLLDTLRRIGDIKDPPEPLPTVAGSALQYRGRLRLAIRGGKVGFFAPGSHDLVEPEVCLVARPAVQQALQTLRSLLDPTPTALAPFDSVEVREACDGSVSLFLQRTSPKLSDSTATVSLLRDLRDHFIVVSHPHEAEDPETWQRFHPAEGCFLRVPPGCFTQVNWAINRALVEQVVAGARSRRLQTFLDLYAGAGNFTLPLLSGGLTGRALEGHPLAVRAGALAAGTQGFGSAIFDNRDLSGGSVAFGFDQGRPDLVVLDPPRAGITFAIDALSALGARYLALCSCHPVTLARDLKRLKSAGFVLESLQPFEMFPQTHHLETLTWLRAPSSRA
jgi:23S rRNA (uracil1939-C5)-methyltransferase